MTPDTDGSPASELHSVSFPRTPPQGVVWLRVTYTGLSVRYPWVHISFRLLPGWVTLDSLLSLSEPPGNLK